MKLEQVLIIQPSNELKFRGPFNVPVTTFMKLINPSDRKVFFKIKTTVPKKYCVRPNSGLIEGRGVIDIAVCLQPFIFDPNEKNKHKFMVQTMFAPDADINIEQAWKEMDPSQLMDSKLKCVFEMPASESAPSSVQQAAEDVEIEDKNNQKKTFLWLKSDVPNLTATSEVMKEATAEVLQLREEGSMLRRENLDLKAELNTLKADRKTQNKFTTFETSQPIPLIYIAAGVSLAIIGIIVGKFIL